MGITIRGDWKDSPEWDMGYASFFRLRRDVAYFVSKEFGDHYANITRINPFDANEYDGITKWLIKKYHCKNAILISCMHQIVDTNCPRLSARQFLI